MPTFRQFTQPILSGLAAFALSLALISGTVSVPQSAAVPAAHSMEYAA